MCYWSPNNSSASYLYILNTCLIRMSWNNATNFTKSAYQLVYTPLNLNQDMSQCMSIGIFIHDRSYDCYRKRYIHNMNINCKFCGKCRKCISDRCLDNIWLLFCYRWDPAIFVGCVFWQNYYTIHEKINKLP